jgi:TPR repeat protein
MGSLIALVGIGYNYENGAGVPEDMDKAVAAYERAIAAGSAVGAEYLAALYENGSIGSAPDPVKALELYSKAAAGGNQSAYVDLGRLYEDGRGTPRDDAKAEQMFRTAIASSDRDAVAEASNILAWHFATRGKNLAEAETLALAAIAGTLPGNDWGKGISLDTLAWIRHLLGRDREALGDAEAAIALIGDDPPAYDRLGDIQMALGNKAEALAAWRHALELDPPSTIDSPEFDAAAIRKKIEAAS